MWPTGVILGALALSLIAFGVAPGAPIVSVPIVLLLLLIGWLLNMSRNRKKVEGVREMRTRGQMADEGAREVEFTDRDKESLYTP